MEEQDEELEEVESPKFQFVHVEDVQSPEDEKDGVIALIKKRSNEIMASFSAACGALAIGTILGWTSPVLPKLNYTDEEESWIGSSMTIGAALSTFHSAYLLDNLGSRATILIQIFPFTIGWLILAFGQTNVSMMYVGRILLGTAVGGCSMSVPVYIAEISSPDVRGALCTLFQFMLNIGIMYVYLLGKFFSVSLLCFACLLWPVINACTMALLHESPYFLAKKQKMDAAEKAVVFFRPNKDPDKEFEEMQESLHIKPESFIRVMQSKPTRKAALVILMLMFFLQVSGINSVMFYSEQVFEMANSSLTGEDAAILLGALQIVVTGIAAVVVDKSGRRVLLISSYIGMCLCHFLLAVYFHTFYLNNEMSWLPLLCILIFAICFSLGSGPIPYTMLGEILPTAAKGSVSCAAVFTSWAMAFVVTRTFHPLKNIHISAPFWLYGMLCVLGTILIFAFVPETKGKTLYQIQKEFEGKESD
ncbi:facilitated trehalose transporter Tret1-like [Ischnura elegans]|uniref:facilitated trehalose transporter Tret1-like n=1 Tax=Ischnura elegans TaxID=197161 RepID=UPI001ED87C46|nr:facilitated trehalose transporter Tret1-like [Ischnura elegans]